jgi:hypothetical protein
MQDPSRELREYERSTITLRLDARETDALLAVLVDCALDHPYKAVAVSLAERLAWERDRFAYREGA